MSKKQFSFLSILSILSIIGISFCLGMTLPKETILDKTLLAILPICLGILAGVLLAIITIVFENTRKDK